MSIAGLATYQSFSMNYSVRRDSKDSDSGDGGNFMNQMLTFHKKDTATVQDKDGKDVSADKEAASELRFQLIFDFFRGHLPRRLSYSR